MIFHRSLSKKKGAAYSFFSGLSEGFLPALALCIFETVLMAVIPVATFIERDYLTSDIIKSRVASRDYYKFLVFANESFHAEELMYVVLGIMGIMSIFTAVKLFRFICDKKTVNVYYSLGIKRSTLFLSKYSSGALLLCASTAAAVILSYAVNLIFAGASWQLSLVLLHLYCGISVFLLIFFSLTAAVFSSVGTVSEAVVYSAAVLFAPTLIFFVTEQIIGAFLPSTTFNDYLVHFNAPDYSWETHSSLVTATAGYNPLLFFAEDLLKFACGIKTENGIKLDALDIGWEFPDLLIHPIWFIFAIVTAFTGAMLFRRIKAENCGFLNSNKLLSNLMIFELCIFGSCLFLTEIRWNGYVFCLGLGAIAAFVFYIIAEIFLKRSFIKILKALYKYVAHMLVVALIIGIFATGAFGYSTYIPNISKVVSAEIYVPFSLCEASTLTMDTSWMSDGFVRFYEPFRLIFMPPMTQQEDIETVMDINRTINSVEKDDGLRSEVVIRYNYENGYSERKHILTSQEEIRSLYLLRGTLAYSDQITNMFYEENRVENIKKECEEYPYSVDETRLKTLCFEYEYASVTAVSENLHESRTLNLTKEQFYTLKDAVYKDIMGTSSGEYFEGTSPQRGVLSFDITPKAYKIDGVNGYDSANDSEVLTEVYDESVSVPSYPVTEITQEFIPQENIAGEETITEETITEEIITEEASLYQYVSYDSDFEPGRLDHSSTAYDVIVTDAMTNTLEALSSMGYADCFASEKAIESVSFADCEATARKTIYNDEMTYIMDFFAQPYDPNEYYAFDFGVDSSYTPEGNITENIITDKDRIAELNTLMKLHEYTFNEGYYCLIKYDDDTYTIKYLSYADAPDYVRQNVTSGA